MSDIVDFPDGEAFLVNLLAPRVTPVGVATNVPKTHTVDKKFVRVSRTGGPSLNIITDGGTYLIECFAKTDSDAYELVSKVRSIVLAAARLSGRVRRVVEGGGPAFLPDPDSGQPKYQILTQLDMRGQVS